MLKELNQVIDYIEDHLTEDITLEEISKYAGVSDYHFWKIFYYLSGLTLSEYIKNRKLSEANIDLLNDEKVTNVTFKYGYESMDGFTWAFKSWGDLYHRKWLKQVSANPFLYLKKSSFWFYSISRKKNLSSLEAQTTLQPFSTF